MTQLDSFHSSSFSSCIGEDKENQKRSLSSLSSTAVCSATKRRRFRFSSPVVSSSAAAFDENDDHDRIHRSRDLTSSRRDGSSISRKSCLSSSFSSTSSSVKKFDAASSSSSSSKISTASGMAPVVGIISAEPTRVRRIPTTVSSSSRTEENSRCGSLARMAVKSGGRKIDLGERGAPGADTVCEGRERRESSLSSSPSSLSSSSGKDITTLWVGNLPQEGSVDESLLHHMFFEFLSSVKNAKVVRDRDTGIPVGYGFVEFTNRADAEYCLRVLNNLWVPNCAWKYKLNWATFNIGEAHLAVHRNTGSSASSNDDSSTSAGKSSGESDSSNNRSGDNRGCSSVRGGGGSNGSGETVSIWVGSLDDEVTQEELHQAFEERYQSVVNVRVITDPVSGKCRGYGFVHFRDGDEAENALGEMNGALCRGRPMKVNRSNSSRDNTRSYGYGNGGGSGTGGATASVGGGGGGGTMDRYAESAIRKLYYATQLAVEQMASSAASSLSCAAALRKRRQEEGSSSGGAQSLQSTSSQQPGSDSYKVYVTGLDAYVTEELLSPHFSPFGTVVSVSIQAVRGKASITFARESSAMNAEYLMNGTQIGSRCVRVRRGIGVIDEEGGVGAGGAAGNGVSGQSDSTCTVSSTGDGSSTAGGISSAYTYGRSFFNNAGHGSSSTRNSADISSGLRGYTSCSNNSGNSVSGYASSNNYYYTGFENNSTTASMSSTTNEQAFYNYYGIGTGSESASNSYLSTSLYPQYYYGDSDSTSGWYQMNTEAGGDSSFGGHPYNYSEATINTDWGLEGYMGYMQSEEFGEVEEEDGIYLLEEYDYAGKGMVIDVLNAMYLRGNPSPMLNLLVLSSSVPTSFSASSLLSSSFFAGKEKEDEDGQERNSLKKSYSNGNRENHEDSNLPLEKTIVSNDKKEDVETFRRLSISSTSTTTSLVSEAAEAACKRYSLEFDIL